MTTFVCKLDRSFDTSTHTIFIGLIEAIHIKEQAPLIYGKKGYKTLTEIV
jgi:flavin reductase (DIM6/NTAB) family NADH-FMN oxidoreductase RutF